MMGFISSEYGRFYDNVDTGQSAQDVYDEWLENKDNQPPPTAEERVLALESALLEIVLGGTK